jgi:hypothetical protein
LRLDQAGGFSWVICSVASVSSRWASLIAVPTPMRPSSNSLPLLARSSVRSLVASSSAY